MRLHYKNFGAMLALTLLLCSLALAPVACNKVHVVNTPPGVIDTEVALWYQATGAVKVWSDTSLQLTQVAVDLHTSFPSEAMYQSTLAGLGKENQIGLEATHFLQKAPQHFDVGAQNQLSGLLDQGITELNDATQVGLLQIKDPVKKQAVDAGLTSLKSALKTIFALVKPSGTPVPEVLK